MARSSPPGASVLGRYGPVIGLVGAVIRTGLNSSATPCLQAGLSLAGLEEGRAKDTIWIVVGLTALVVILAVVITNPDELGSP